MQGASWSNFSGRVTCAPTRVARPKGESDLIDAVRAASADGRGLRVAGTGHSFTPLCATLGTLVSLDDSQGVVSIDRERSQAVIRAGTKLHALGEPLLAA